ncbi:hypothetical protein ACFFOP_04260 [Sinosporangium siamense]
MVLSSCATDVHWRNAEPDDAPVWQDVPSPYVEEDDGDEDFGEDEGDDVVAHCVRRLRVKMGTYRVVADKHCDRAGKHTAFMWYYGGKMVKGLVSKGKIKRPPKDVWVSTRSGDEISRTGRIIRGGFGFSDDDEDFDEGSGRSGAGS